MKEEKKDDVVVIGDCEVKIENQNVADGYGFQICPMCQKRQGTVLGPIGSYILLCEGCAEKLDEEARNDPICRMKSEEMYRQLKELGDNVKEDD